MSEWEKKTVEKDNFFKMPQHQAKKDSPDDQSEAQKPRKLISGVEVSSEVVNLLENARQLAQECRFTFAEKELFKIHEGSARAAFTIAVIGEFSRGKSTLINNLLELKETALPTGALPTTAMLTTVMFHETSKLVHIGINHQTETLPLCESSWESFIAGGTRDNAIDVMQVGVPNDWLRETGIHLLDTPGAGDLNAERARLVIDALMCSDGAIIAVSALAPMSLSEKLFIEQNLAAKKMPRTILVVTKLDEVKDNQRASVVSFILETLKTWQMHISVFIPQEDLSIPDCPENVQVGNAAIRKTLSEWVKDPDREQLIKEQILAQLFDVANVAAQAAQTQLELVGVADEEQKEESEKKCALLETSRMKWEDYRIEMQRRAGACRDWLVQAVKEKQITIVEKLSFDLAHTNNPKLWWEKDYPYRLKIEMTILAGNLENNLNQYIVGDVKWLNDAVFGIFQRTVPVKKMVMVERGAFQDIQAKENSDLQNLQKARIASRIVTGAATVLGYVLFGPFGSIISVGGGVLSDVLIGKSIESQKEFLQHEIEKSIPQAIDSAISISENRIQELYTQAISEATRQEGIWMDGQLAAIEQSAKKRLPTDATIWNDRLAQWITLRDKAMEG